MERGKGTLGVKGRSEGTLGGDEEWRGRRHWNVAHVVAQYSHTHTYVHTHVVHAYRHAPLEEGHVLCAPHQSSVHHDGLEAAPVQGPQLKGEEREVNSATTSMRGCRHIERQLLTVNT